MFHQVQADPASLCSLENILSALSLSSSPPAKVPGIECVSCKSMDKGSSPQYNTTFKIMSFYQNEAIKKLNLIIGFNTNAPFCDKCMLKDSIALEFYYQNAKLVALKLYEEIIINLNTIFPGKTDYDIAVANLKSVLERIQEIMDFAKSFSSQSFRIYRLVLERRRNCGAHYARTAMNDFIRLESTSRKIYLTYEFVSRLMDNEYCDNGDLQLMVNKHALNLANSIMDINEKYLEDFDKHADTFATSIQLGCGMLHSEGFKKKNPEAIEFPNIYNPESLIINSPPFIRMNGAGVPSPQKLLQSPINNWNRQFTFRPNDRNGSVHYDKHNVSQNSDDSFLELLKHIDINSI